MHREADEGSDSPSRAIDTLHGSDLDKLDRHTSTDNFEESQIYVSLYGDMIWLKWNLEG